jgi:hypothetical protein
MTYVTPRLNANAIKFTSVTCIVPLLVLRQV